MAGDSLFECTKKSFKNWIELLLGTSVFTPLFSCVKIYDLNDISVRILFTSMKHSRSKLIVYIRLCIK